MCIEVHDFMSDARMKGKELCRKRYKMVLRDQNKKDEKTAKIEQKKLPVFYGIV
jgi:hypothetical protein